MGEQAVGVAGDGPMHGPEAQASLINLKQRVIENLQGLVDRAYDVIVGGLRDDEIQEGKSHER